MNQVTLAARRINDIEKAHALAAVIMEAEELGVFEAMDAKTRANIENAHETANVQRLQEADELRRDANRLLKIASFAADPDPLIREAQAWHKKAEALEVI
jgi:hypothetical protein